VSSLENINDDPSSYRFDGSGCVLYSPYTATINHYSFLKPPTATANPGLSESPNPHRDNGVAEIPVLTTQPQSHHKVYYFLTVVDL